MSALEPMPRVPVSWGELLDKITILEIKRERLASEEARRNVVLELDLLRNIAGPVLGSSELVPELTRLRSINIALWQIEDEIRAMETRQDFGTEFIHLARSVYLRNDERSAVKRRINTLLGSALMEEKSHGASSPPASG